MNQNNSWRKANGKRIEGEALSRKIASDVRGMMLAMAYMKVKGAELKLRIHSLDGQVSQPTKDKDNSRVNVEVVEGFVKKAWIG